MFRKKRGDVHVKTRENQSRYAYPFLTLLLLLGSGLILLLPVHTLATLFTFDDTYYYLKPARVFWETGMISFDRVHPTNGFQPLWMLILILLAKLIPTPEAFLRATLILSWALILLGLAGLLRFAQSKREALLIILLGTLVFSERHVAWNGMESALLVLLTPFWLSAYYAAWRTPERIGRLTFLTSLLALARLDLAVLFLPLLILAWKHRKVFTSLVGFIPLVLYALANKVFLGVWLPVSGVVKTHSAFSLTPVMTDVARALASLLVWPVYGMLGFLLPLSLLQSIHTHFLSMVFRNILGSILLLLLSLLLFLLVGRVAWKKWRKECEETDSKPHSGSWDTRIMERIARVHPATRLLILTLLIHLLSFSMLTPGYAFYNSWHYTFEYTLLVLLTARGLARLRKPLSLLTLLILILLVGAKLVWFFSHHDARLETCLHEQRESCERYALAEKIKTSFSPGTLGSWNAGEIGYWLYEWNVTNLDCLINSPDCAQRIREEGMHAYLDEENITLLADYCHVVKPYGSLLLREGRFCLVERHAS